MKLILLVALALPAIPSQLAQPFAIECPVDEPDPQAVAYSATVLFDGDVACEFFIRRKVQQGETDEAWRDRICAAISAYADAAGYESWEVTDHEWLVP